MKYIMTNQTYTQAQATEIPQISRNTENDIFLVSSILVIILIAIVAFGGTLRDA